MMQIRLSGSGGQGLITAGIILAEAAVIDGKETVQTQDYGPEARGGSSKAECIISETSIDYPKVTIADVVLCMNQESYNKYGTDVNANGKILIDTTFVKDIKADSRNVAVPITKTAIDELGKSIFANIVALGAVVGLTGAVSLEALEKAVLDRVPKGTEEKNRKALALGWEMAKKA